MRSLRTSIDLKGDFHIEIAKAVGVVRDMLQ